MHVITMIPANFPSRASRGAQFAATAFASVGRWMLRVVQPAASRPLTRTEEAAEVRSLAQSVCVSDPRFAQDLFAAADRHERGSD